MYPDDGADGSFGSIHSCVREYGAVVGRGGNVIEGTDVGFLSQDDVVVVGKVAVNKF